MSTTPKRIADVEIVKVQTGDTLESLANANGLSWQQLTRFNWGTEDPKQINRCLREIVGCTRRTADGKNYMFHSTDDPGLMYVPKPLQLPGLALNRPYTLRVSRPRLHGRVTIQTVDYFGHRLPNIALHLRPNQGGAPMDCQTNENGVFSSSKVESGRYFIEERDGSATFYYQQLDKREGNDSNDSFGHLEPAQFTTQTHFDTIVSVVAGPLPSPAEEEQRRLNTNTYYRRNRQIPTAGLGSETENFAEGLTRRSFQTSADNLLLAAGWDSTWEEINWQNLVANVLPGWLDAYYPSVVSRTYYVIVLDDTAKTFTIWDPSGDRAVRLSMKPDMQFKGLYGMYAVLQNESGPYFVDMATRSSIIDVLNETEDQGLESLLIDPAQYIDYANSHTGSIEIVCLAPSANALGDIALQGGTGRLEDYGHSAAVNAKIHNRNIAVCRHMRDIYEAYIRGYIDRVKATGSEDSLRALGPPLTFYEMPLPAGYTDDQAVDIFNAQFTNNVLDAWIAIGQRMDGLNDRKSQGHPFFRFKVKYKKDKKLEGKRKAGWESVVGQSTLDLSYAAADEVEVEAFVDIQVIDGDIRMIHRQDMSVKVAAKLRHELTVEGYDPAFDARTSSRNGYPIELSFKQSLGNPEKATMAFRLDKYNFEVDNVGKTKLSVEVEPGIWLDAEYSVPAAEMGIGTTIKFKDVAAKMKDYSKKYELSDAASDRIERWSKNLEAFEVQALVGFVGQRQETALAVNSRAPGFFQRRSLSDLFSPELQWNDLSQFEMTELATLGWSQEVWNKKYEEEMQDKLPASIGKSRSELAPAELIAIVNLGFYAYEDYGKKFQKGLTENADFVF